MSKFDILDNRHSAGIRPREVLKHGITDAILNGETALFDVLPGLGKSRSVAIAAKAYIPISVFTNLEDNYDQFEEWCRESGVPFEKFPVSDKDCPTLRGDYSDHTTAKTAIDAYGNGWSASVIHQEFDLPCQQDGVCEYMEKVKSIDVNCSGILAGHYTQAYVEPYVKDRVVVLDEDAFERFYETIQYPVQKAQEFIDTLDDFPFDEARRPEPGEEERREKALNRLREVGLEPKEHPDSIGEFHAKAPLLAYAIYGAERLDNGLNYLELPGDRTAVFDSLHPKQENNHNDGSPTIWLLDPPDLSEAEAVIGLDATPCIPKWERILGEDFSHYRLFDDDGRNQYLRNQGYEFVQLNGHAWPAQGGRLSIPKCEAYLREVYRKHGERPDLITSIDVRTQLEENELANLWNRDLHFGDLRGKNHLKDSELLVVLGSPSRSDDYIHHLTALFGESATRKQGTQGPTLSYGNPTADAILDTTRRGGVFQAIMRAGREEGAEATIYIATGLVPDWLETEKAWSPRPNAPPDACTRIRSPGEREVIKALRGATEVTTTDITEKVSISRRMVKKHRQSLRDAGLIEKKGKTKGAKYSDDGLGTINIAGEVDLSFSGTMPLKGSIRGKFPNKSRSSALGELPNNQPGGYPDWMRDVQRRFHERKEREQMKQRRRAQR